MYLTKELFLSNVQINNAIKEAINTYCREVKTEHIPDIEDIVIHDSGDIEFSWEENDACHCHPNYVTKSAKIDYEVFVKWFESNSIEI